MPGDRLTSAQDDHLVDEALHDDVPEAKGCRNSEPALNKAP
jgi:hypothetical protein